MKTFAKQIFVVMATTLLSNVVLAEEVAGAASSGKGLIGLGAGLAIGLAAIGGALGQGKTVSSALDGIARNPAAQGKIFTPMIIGLALIESLVIYAFVIAFFLNGHL